MLLGSGTTVNVSTEHWRVIGQCDVVAAMRTVVEDVDVRIQTKHRKIARFRSMLVE